MRLVRLNFDDDADEIEPTRVTVDMSKDEALLVAHMIGSTSNLQRDELMSYGGVIGSGIYDCLVGGVFNRYWDNGVDDALRER